MFTIIAVILSALGGYLVAEEFGLAGLIPFLPIAFLLGVLGGVADSE